MSFGTGGGSAGGYGGFGGPVGGGKVGGGGGDKTGGTGGGSGGGGWSGVSDRGPGGSSGDIGASQGGATAAGPGGYGPGGGSGGGTRDPLATLGEMGTVNYGLGTVPTTGLGLVGPSAEGEGYGFGSYGTGLGLGDRNNTSGDFSFNGGMGNLGQTVGAVKPSMGMEDYFRMALPTLAKLGISGITGSALLGALASMGTRNYLASNPREVNYNPKFAEHPMEQGRDRAQRDMAGQGPGREQGGPGPGNLMAMQGGRPQGRPPGMPPGIRQMGPAPISNQRWIGNTQQTARQMASQGYTDPMQQRQLMQQYGYGVRG